MKGLRAFSIVIFGILMLVSAPQAISQVSLPSKPDLPPSLSPEVAPSSPPAPAAEPTPDLAPPAPSPSINAAPAARAAPQPPTPANQAGALDRSERAEAGASRHAAELRRLRARHAEAAQQISTAARRASTAASSIIDLPPTVRRRSGLDTHPLVLPIVASVVLVGLGLAVGWRRRRTSVDGARRPHSRHQMNRAVAGRGAASPLVIGVLAVGGAALVGWLIVHPGDVRLAMLTAMLGMVAGLGAVSSRLLVPALIIWLAALGLVRRLVTDLIEPTQFDVLLLLGPAVVLALIIGTPSFRAALLRRSRLAILVAILAILVFVAAINPLNESLLAGLAGLMFVLIPVLGFWIGTRIDDQTLRSSLCVVAVLACAAAVYGLFQTFSGFPVWDERWIADAGYIALNVGGEIRPFASFSSASEYSAYLSVGLVIVCAALVGRARYLPLALPVIGLLATAIFFSSKRAAVFTTLAALLLMLAARRRVRGPIAITLAATLILLVPFVAQRLAPAGSDNPLVAHQVGGLADPTDKGESTLVLHGTIILDSLVQSVTTPTGSGLANVTISGGRLGDAQTEAGGGAAGAETDIETAAVAMGIPGLLVFLLIAATGFARMYAVAQRQPSFLALAGLGIITATGLQWLNGGQYAVGLLPWLLLGWAEAHHLRRRSASAGATFDPSLENDRPLSVVG